MNPINVSNQDAMQRYNKAMKESIDESVDARDFMMALGVDDMRSQIDMNEAKAATKRAESMKM